MTISIIGCGWLGLPLGAFLVDKGWTVKGSTTTAEKLEIIKNKGIQPFLIDLQSIISNKKSTEQLDNFFKTNILYINIPPSRRNPNIEVDYPKWVKFLAERCEEFGIEKVIFVSSTGVYPSINGIVTEATSTQPQKVSQKAIVVAEQLLQQNQNFKTTILRPAGLVGGNRNAGRWFAGRQNVKGGNVPVNLVHLDDCIGVTYAVLEQAVFGEVFNLCADEHPKKSIFYPHQAKKYGFEIPTFIMDEVDFKVVSNQKSKDVLNYQYKWKNPMDF